MRVLQSLKQKRAMDDAALVQLAGRVGVPVATRDIALLTTTGMQSGVAGSRNAEGEIARERLLLKLDTYEALRRSRISQWLAQVSVVLSIISALISIYANLIKK